MIESEQLENRRVQIVDVNLVLHRRAAEFIRRAIDRAALHAAARQPGAERAIVVVAARILVAIAVPNRLAPEFSAPHHQRAVEQAALLEVGEEGGARSVDFARALGQTIFEILMMIPAARPDLHEAHAALDESACDEQLPALRGISVQLADALRLLADVEGVARLHLHLVSHLERLDARLELRFLLEILAVHRVELCDEIELMPLFLRPEKGIPNVLDHLVHARAFRVHAGSLIDTGEESRLPVRRAAGRRVARAQRDEAGHVLVLGAETVEHPRAKARLRQPQRTRVHENRGHVMRRDVGVHRADDRHVIDVLSNLGKHLAHLDARLAVLRELERRPVSHAVVAGDGFAVQLREHRLGIPGVHL